MEVCILDIGLDKGFRNPHGYNGLHISKKKGDEQSSATY